MARSKQEDALRARIEQAAFTGDIVALTELFGQAGEAVFKNPGNVLWLSMEGPQYESVECLLQHEVLVQTNEVRAAVVLQDDAKMLDLLLRYGWDMDMHLEPEVPSALALALQCQDYRCAEWLLVHGASPNTKCTYDITPLSFAIQYSTIPFIQRLLDQGADIHHCQAVHHAVYRTLPDYLDVLNFVLSKDPPINHILWQEDLIQYYMRRVFFLGTPLHDAAHRGLLDICQVLFGERRKSSHQRFSGRDTIAKCTTRPAS